MTPEAQARLMLFVWAGVVFVFLLARAWLAHGVLRVRRVAGGRCPARTRPGASGRSWLAMVEVAARLAGAHRSRRGVRARGFHLGVAWNAQHWRHLAASRDAIARCLPAFDGAFSGFDACGVCRSALAGCGRDDCFRRGLRRRVDFAAAAEASRCDADACDCDVRILFRGEFGLRRVHAEAFFAAAGRRHTSLLAAAGSDRAVRRFQLGLEHSVLHASPRVDLQRALGNESRLRIEIS